MGRGSIDCYIAILDGKKKTVAVKVKKGLYALNGESKISVIQAKNVKI